MSKRFGRWVEPKQYLPEVDGDYMCLIKNGEMEFEDVRRLNNGVWFGGCRPFTEHEVVMLWYEHPVLNLFQQQLRINRSHAVNYDFACRITIAIEHLTNRQADIRTVLRVMENQLELYELETKALNMEASTIVEHCRSVDGVLYQQMLAYPIAALKKASLSS